MQYIQFHKSRPPKTCERQSGGMLRYSGAEPLAAGDFVPVHNLCMWSMVVELTQCLSQAHQGHQTLSDHFSTSDSAQALEISQHSVHFFTSFAPSQPSQSCLDAQSRHSMQLGWLKEGSAQDHHPSTSTLKILKSQFFQVPISTQDPSLQSHEIFGSGSWRLCLALADDLLLQRLPSDAVGRTELVTAAMKAEAALVTRRW